MIAELQLPTADLLVPLEGDVTTDHVEEEDPQGPHGGAVCVVLVERDPLRRGVYSGTCNVPVMFTIKNTIMPLLPHHRNLCRARLLL